MAVDLLGVEQPLELAKKLENSGVAWLDVHCPIDAQMQGQDPLALALVTLLMVVCSTGLGVLIAAVARTERATSA